MFLIIIYCQCLRLGSGSWLLMDVVRDVSFDVLLVWSHVPCTCSCPSSTHQDQMFAMFSSFQKCVLILVGARQLNAAEHTEMQHLVWNFLSFLCCEHELANK